MPQTSRLRRRLLSAVGATLLPLAAWAAEEKSLRIVSSNLPPLILANGGSAPGALHDVVVELCRRMRLTPKFEFVPWRRAIFLSTSMRATAILPLTRLPEREQQFRWLAPLYEENYVFMARRGQFDVAHPDAMKHKRIAILRGSTMIKVLQDREFPNIVEAASADEVFRFLNGGMADAAFGERAIVTEAIRARERVADFEVSKPILSTTSWLAGSLDFDQAFAARCQRTMKQMVADGSVERILKKYALA